MCVCGRAAAAAPCLGPVPRIVNILSFRKTWPTLLLPLPLPLPRPVPLLVPTATSCGARMLYGLLCFAIPSLAPTAPPAPAPPLAHHRHWAGRCAVSVCAGGCSAGVVGRQRCVVFVSDAAPVGGGRWAVVFVCVARLRLLLLAIRILCAAARRFWRPSQYATLLLLLAGG